VSPRPNKLYDQRQDETSLNEVERMLKGCDVNSLTTMGTKFGLVNWKREIGLDTACVAAERD
jgi:hypothetical protein